MAEAVIGIIAGEIVALLVSEVVDTVGKLWGVKHELKALKDAVSTIQAQLNDAQEKYYQSHEVRDWVENLKDAFYEAQDVLEEFDIVEQRGHKKIAKVSTIFLSPSQLAFKMEMSNKLRAVRERIGDIENGRKFNLVERPERESRKREETHSYEVEGHIIGRDADKKAVMDFLLNSDVQENVSILPIVGIGGLGKTALAQIVYNDAKVKEHFHLRMWVYVSDEFDVRRILKNMMVCLKENVPTNVTTERLQSELREKIDGKRYLLVLDDLWNEQLEKWRSLEKLLVGGARGSRILITTRLPLVARITRTKAHPLEGLSDEASFDLLTQIACCAKEEIQDRDMQAIVKDIVKKCSGVPLVVRTVGSLLFNISKDEWLKFKENELPNVSQNQDSIKSVLKLSYDHLPSHLKQCFAFCSLFPKDYEIEKQTLVNLWMAEGFIQPSKGRRDLEDTADEYFMDLLWRNFFQDFKKDPDTNLETCKMHDLMHDLACSIAGTECWGAWNDPKLICEKTRHISYSSNCPLMGERSYLNASTSRTILNASALRTILFTSLEMERYKYMEMEERDLCLLIQSFKRLRILDLSGYYIENVPESICKLKHLTYLDLSHNGKLKRLPNSITRLQNLQTLNLYYCVVLEELPTDLGELVSLRNLNIDECGKLSFVPRGLGQLSSLHRLTRFILPKEKAPPKNYSTLGELNGLKNIRGSLRIENLGSVTDAEAESKAAKLVEKTSLESLKLDWGDFDTDDAEIGDRDEKLLDGLRPPPKLQKLSIDGYKGESFPKWMTEGLVSSLGKLVELRLKKCRRCTRLPPLGQLTSLESLSICGLTELEGIGPDDSLTSITSFPRLLELNVENCEKLKAMPLTPHLERLKLVNANSTLINNIFGLNKLKHLEIEGMESLKYLPEKGLKSLTSLECLRINNCKELDLSKDESGNILDFQELQSLRSVQLIHLPKLASLPRWLLQASNLEYLSISWCHRLNSLSLEDVRHVSNLVGLSLDNCNELDLSKDESDNILDFQGLQSLCSVKLRYLPKLSSLPRWLLQASNLELLVITWCHRLNSLPLDDVGHLSNLVDLSIGYCNVLDLCKDESGNILDFQGLQSLQSASFSYLPKLASLPQWLFQASNLQRLSILRCSRLKSLSLGLRHLSNLESLSIDRCEELDLSRDESGNILDLQGLESLRFVDIRGIPKLESLPQWLLRVSNLEHLKISSCLHLKELEQIEALQSLQLLYMSECPSLTSLPEGMRRLTSLTHLRIPEGLGDRYKIAHIPHIS